MAVQRQVPCKETFGAVSPSPECWQSNRQAQPQEVKFNLIYWSSACDQARNDSSPVFVSAYSVSRGVLTPATRPWRWNQRCRPIPALQKWDNETGVFVWVEAYMTGLMYLSPDHHNSNTSQPSALLLFSAGFTWRRRAAKFPGRLPAAAVSVSLVTTPTWWASPSCLQEKALLLCL